MVTEQGRPSVEVAKELGICIETLRTWLKTSAGVSTGQADRQNREVRRVRELEAENRALKKQLSEKEEVIDVLKRIRKPFMNGFAFFQSHRGQVSVHQGRPLGSLCGTALPYLGRCV